MKKQLIVSAILTTTILPVDGVYVVETFSIHNNSFRLDGIPHYVGHPSTREIVEALGAVKSENNLFKGLEIGESALCVSIRQGRSSRATEGKTVDQEIQMEDLAFRIILRLPDVENSIL